MPIVCQNKSNQAGNIMKITSKLDKSLNITSLTYEILKYLVDNVKMKNENYYGIVILCHLLNFLISRKDFTRTLFELQCAIKTSMINNKNKSKEQLDLYYLST
jgi:hypothetical protein